MFLANFQPLMVFIFYKERRRMAGLLVGWLIWRWRKKDQNHPRWLLSLSEYQLVRLRTLNLIIPFCSYLFSRPIVPFLQSILYFIHCVSHLFSAPNGDRSLLGWFKCGRWQFWKVLTCAHICGWVKKLIGWLHLEKTWVVIAWHHCTYNDTMYRMLIFTSLK